MRYLTPLLLLVVFACNNEEPSIDCNMSDLTAEAESTADSGCGTTTGIAVVDATGGTGPYMFSIDGGAEQTSNTFENLGQGSHTVTVTDETGCNTVVLVDVLSGLTYTNDARPIFEKSCAITGCHVAGTGLPQWLDYDVAKASAANIKAQTQSGNMPRTGSLTADEIAILACWADDGGPL